MVEPGSPLLAFSDHAAELVERTASSVVAVQNGGRWPSSGIHWRSGVIVTAEEVLERDENIKLTLPGGRVADASLAGRDPTTDVAVLRFQPDGLPVATTTEASPRAGHVVVAVGNYDGAPLAALGIVALAGGAWHSLRGGTIGRVIGMTVLGPRRRALSIPSSTIDRTVDQLLARGHVFRGYLGAGLQSVKRERTSNGSQASAGQAGVLVVSHRPERTVRACGNSRRPAHQRAHRLRPRD
jgi:S1-C subfamily serine protease